jgi:hypothetical protein
MKKYPQPCVQKERLEQNLKVLERALLRYEPKEKVVKKAVPKKVEPPKPVPKKVEPPKPVPKKVEPPKVEPPKVEPPKVEPPKVEPPKVVIGKDEIPIPEPKKEETKKTLVSQEIKPVVKAEKTEKKAVVNTIVKKELVRKPKEEEKINPNIKNLEFMTVEDLRKIVSREKLFRGVSKMKKEELLRRIKQSEWWRKNSDKDISKLKKDLCYNPHNLAIKDPVLVKMDRSVYENLIKKI